MKRKRIYSQTGNSCEEESSYNSEEDLNTEDEEEHRVLGERLLLLRENKEIYQKEVAAYLKVSIGTISNYEKGVHDPDLKTLCKLADFYDVSTDYLLGRTPIPDPAPAAATGPTEEMDRMILSMLKLPPQEQEVMRLFEGFVRRHKLQAKGGSGKT